MQKLMSAFLHNNNATSSSNEVNAIPWELSKNESIFKFPQLSHKGPFSGLLVWVRILMRHAHYTQL